MAKVIKLLPKDFTQLRMEILCEILERIHDGKFFLLIVQLVCSLWRMIQTGVELLSLRNISDPVVSIECDLRLQCFDDCAKALLICTRVRYWTA